MMNTPPEKSPESLARKILNILHPRGEKAFLTIDHEGQIQISVLQKPEWESDADLIASLRNLIFMEFESNGFRFYTKNPNTGFFFVSGIKKPGRDPPEEILEAIASILRLSDYEVYMKDQGDDPQGI